MDKKGDRVIGNARGIGFTLAIVLAAGVALASMPVTAMAQKKAGKGAASAVAPIEVTATGPGVTAPPPAGAQTPPPGPVAEVAAGEPPPGAAPGDPAAAVPSVAVPAATPEGAKAAEPGPAGGAAKGDLKGDDDDDNDDDDDDEDEGSADHDDDDDWGHGSREDIVLMGESKVVEAGEVVKGDIVIVGGDLTLHGKVRGDAVCVGGHLVVGPTAFVRGDLVNVGGDADVDPAAIIRGERVTVQGVPLGPIQHLKYMDHARSDAEGSGVARRFARLISDVVFIAFMMFIALLMTVFMPRQLERVEEHLAGDFPRSALLGFAVMLLLPLVILILAVTLIGIPFIPILLLVFAVAGAIGYIAMARILGRRLVGEKHVMMQILVGLLLLAGASVVGSLVALPGGIFMMFAHAFRFVGGLIAIGVGFLGIGGVLYSRFGRRSLTETQASRAANGHRHNGWHAHAHPQAAHDAGPHAPQGQPQPAPASTPAPVVDGGQARGGESP